LVIFFTLRSVFSYFVGDNRAPMLDIDNKAKIQYCC
jgi:hypothetical protein